MTSLTFDSRTIEARLTARVSLLEFSCVLFGIGAVLIFAWLFSQGEFVGRDYLVFANAARGDFTGFYYAHWLLPIFAPFSALPDAIGYGAWGVCNILGLWFAMRVFKSFHALAFFVYPLYYTIYWGQIIGLLIGAVALLWWMLHRGQWLIAALALVLLCGKFQVGIPVALALLMTARVTWRDRLLVILFSLILVLVSLLIYPNWVLTLYNGMFGEVRANDLGSVSLWRYFGAWAMLAWVPVIFIKQPINRLRLIVAASAIGLPYFQQTDLMMLYIFMPITPLFLLGEIGFLMSIYGWPILKLMAAVPITAYVFTIAQSIHNTVRSPFLRVDTSVEEASFGVN